MTAVGDPVTHNRAQNRTTLPSYSLSFTTYIYKLRVTLPLIGNGVGACMAYVQFRSANKGPEETACNDHGEALRREGDSVTFQGGIGK